MQRVAISGMGAISAAGHDVDRLWEACRDGRPSTRRLDGEAFSSSRVKIAATVEGFDAEALFDEAIVRAADRFALLVLHAAREAVASAGLESERFDDGRTGIVLGTGIGGIGTTEEGYKSFHDGQRIAMLSIPRAMPSAAAAQLAIAYGVKGPSLTVTSACASSAQALGLALQLVRAGVVDRVIAGGSEACITPATMRSWEQLRVLTTDQCRPFSVGRSGMTIGEGAGIVILESEAALARRGATPIAWLAGYGTTSDAREMLNPDSDGAAQAMEMALADAGLDLDEIGYVNAHGTGTVANDINEAVALRQVFGSRLDGIPVSSSKPVIGHTLGAAGVLELIVTVCSLRDQVIPPQINCREIDPRCPIGDLPTTARKATFSAAISNSFAFGGVNATLAVTRAA